jgi:hypothetical protein
MVTVYAPWPGKNRPRRHSKEFVAGFISQEISGTASNIILPHSTTNSRGHFRYGQSSKQSDESLQKTRWQALRWEPSHPYGPVFLIEVHMNHRPGTIRVPTLVPDLRAFFYSAFESFRVGLAQEGNHFFLRHSHLHPVKVLLGDRTGSPTEEKTQGPNAANYQNAQGERPHPECPHKSHPILTRVNAAERHLT